MDDVSYAPLVRGMTWSYSRLTAFASCPYMWYLRYIAFPRAKPEPLFYSSYGQLMHRLLADYYSGRKTQRALLSEFPVAFVQSVPGRPAGRASRLQYFEDGLRCLRQLRPVQGEVVAVEKRLRFSVGGLPFVGYADLVTRRDGEIVITDHKSRSLQPRSGRATPTKADAQLDETLRQLYLYAAWVRQHFDRDPAALQIHCFRTGRVVEERFSTAAFEKAQQWAIDAVEAIAAETEFSPNIQWFFCRRLCDMCQYCCYSDLA